MNDEFYESEEVEGKYMEVIIDNGAGEEAVYWVSLAQKPDDDDEFDWSINQAVSFHNSTTGQSISEDEAEALEPFSRHASEFTFIG